MFKADITAINPNTTSINYDTLKHKDLAQLLVNIQTMINITGQEIIEIHIYKEEV